MILIIWFKINNKLKDIDIKNRTYYFSDNMINIKNFVLYKIKIDKKSYKNILIYYIGYLTLKNLRYVKISSVNPLYLIINKVNGYFEEIYGNKYLTLIPTNESKNTLKKYEELWNNIRNIIKSKTNNWDDCDENYEKIDFNSDDDLPLKITLVLRNMIIVAGAVFHEDSKYYPQVFLDECLCKL